MKIFRSKSIALIMVLSLVIWGFAPIFGAMSYAADHEKPEATTTLNIVPVYHDGNTSDEDYKIDSVPSNGDYTVSLDGEVIGTLTISNSIGKMFDWSFEPESNYQVEEVQVKAGNGYYAFTYVDGALGDTGLFSPNNQNNEGSWAQISHVSFNFIEVEQEVPTGSINISKVIEDADENEITDDNTMFTVNITGPEGYDEEHTFSVDSPLSIENLLLGTYEIEEINIPEGYEFVSISSDEFTLQVGNLTEDVIVTNMVEETEITLGTLTIEKVLLDTDETEILDDDTIFTVLVVGDNDYNEEHTFSVNEDAVITGLYPSTYYIYEVNTPDGFELVSIVEDEVELTFEDLNKTVIVTNMVAEDDVVADPTGSITIEKIFSEDSEAIATDNDNAQEFTVRVTNDKGYDAEFNFSVKVPVLITDLELGTYMIEEINLPDGYAFEMISDDEIIITEENLDFTVVVENSIIEEEIEEEIDDIDIPEGSDDEEIILDEEIPLGTDELPRTGQRHVRDFYILGLMISGLGVALKRYFI